MKIYVRGKGSVNLRQNDFVASGGEGKIYHVGHLAYKIYHDRKKLPPEAKLTELSVLKNNSNIVGPLDTILDKNNRRIGYTTQWVDGISMCKLFVMGFRKREGVTNKNILELVENMKKTIRFIHDNEIVMVDGNELNYIVDNDFVTPYFIDTTCWQTKSYPASVIMPSIRDWSSKRFTKLTDWFSFGVIACWLFTGVHPFKGKIDAYDKKFKDNVERIKNRVIDCVSIFNKNVRVAPNANLKGIPDHYKQWFLKMFENGERLLPPATPGFVVAIPITVRKITGTDNFVIKPYKAYDSDIIWFTKVNGIPVVKTVSDIIFKRWHIPADPSTNVVFSPKLQIPVISRIDNGKLRLRCPEGSITVGDIDATDTMVVENTLYYRNYDKFVEMDMVDHPSERRVIASMKTTWDIMPNSSKLYAGVIIQNMLGKIHVTIPVVSGDGRNKCFTKAIPELDGYRIYDAKHANGVLVVHGQKGSDIHTMVFRFEKDYSKYDFRIIECNDIGDVNLTVLDNGVAILIPGDGVLEVFRHTPFVAGDVKSIQDPVISTDMRLCKDGNTALFIRGNEIYKISMK